MNSSCLYRSAAVVAIASFLALSSGCVVAPDDGYYSGYNANRIPDTMSPTAPITAAGLPVTTWRHTASMMAVAGMARAIPVHTQRLLFRPAPVHGERRVSLNERAGLTEIQWNDDVDARVPAP